ncbi:MAG: TetR/AcrR family transcriptional regulator [Acidimicrobiales bacterium]
MAETVKRRPGRPRALPLAEQREVVLAAARRVFAEHGYRGATIERVAREAHMPRPRVYELFGGKDELFSAVVDDAADRIVARLSASFGESADYPLRPFVRHNFAAVFDLFERDRDAVTVLLHAERGNLDPPMFAAEETRRRVLAEVTGLTRSRWESLGLDVGDASEMMALMFFRMAEGVAVRQADDGNWDREALIDLLTDFTVGGLERLWQHAGHVIEAAGRRVG